MEKNFEIKKDDLCIKCRAYSYDFDYVDKVIISCHGFTGSKDNKTANALANELKENDGYMIISFDWPCHGDDNRKEVDLDVCNKYLKTVIDYVHNTLDIDEIYGQGTSFGGYLILKYISENGNPFEKITLRCPAVNMYDALVNIILNEEQLNTINNGGVVYCGNDRDTVITKKLVESLRENDILKRDFSNYSDKIVTIHGNKDTLIDYNVDKDFSEKNGIEFITSEGTDHGFNVPGKIEECASLFMKYYSNNYKVK